MGGSGKSNYLRHHVKTHWKGLPAWWLFDTQTQHSILSSITGAPIIHDAKQLTYRPLILQPTSKIQEQFRIFCKAAMLYRNLPVAIEETHKFSTSHKIGEEFADLQSSGRPRGVTYVCLTRHPKRIFPDIYSDSHHLVTFKLKLPAEMEYLKEWFGEGVQQILTAPRYSYIYAWHEDEPQLMPPVELVA